MCVSLSMYCFLFFFNDTATTEIYTLSLHDALPIWCIFVRRCCENRTRWRYRRTDRKSTCLNSSHLVISYAVFCLKKKQKDNTVGHHGAAHARAAVGAAAAGRG